MRHPGLQAPSSLLNTLRGATRLLPRAVASKIFFAMTPRVAFRNQRTARGSDVHECGENFFTSAETQRPVRVRKRHFGLRLEYEDIFSYIGFALKI